MCSSSYPLFLQRDTNTLLCPSSPVELLLCFSFLTCFLLFSCISLPIRRLHFFVTTDGPSEDPAWVGVEFGLAHLFSYRSSRGVLILKTCLRFSSCHFIYNEDSLKSNQSIEYRKLGVGSVFSSAKSAVTITVAFHVCSRFFRKQPSPMLHVSQIVPGD